MYNSTCDGSQILEIKKEREREREKEHYCLPTASYAVLCVM